MKVDEIKARAVKLAEELHVEKIIRTVALSGQCDEVRINYHCFFENMIIRATFGAGTNSTIVDFDGETVYRSHDYGQRLLVFRFGGWFDKLKKRAREFDAIRFDIELTQKEQQEKEMIKNFLPLESSND